MKFWTDAMAATQRAIPGQHSHTAPAAPQATGHSEVSRLAALHHEAEETARLANLLGRTPYAAALLVAGCGLTTTMAAAADPAALTAWLLLVLFGISALVRAYGQAMRAPFERAPLQAFSQDLTAMLTYAGFAWGAGAFLALPVQTGLLGALAFGLGPAVAILALLRTPSVSLAFLGPAATLASFALVLRPFSSGLLAAALMLIAAGLLAAAALWLEGRAAAQHSVPRLADLPFPGRTGL